MPKIMISPIGPPYDAEGGLVHCPEDNGGAVLTHGNVTRSRACIRCEHLDPSRSTEEHVMCNSSGPVETNTQTHISPSEMAATREALRKIRSELFDENIKR